MKADSADNKDAMMVDSFAKADLDKDGLLNEAEHAGFMAIQKETQMAAYGSCFTYTDEDLK